MQLQFESFLLVPAFLVGVPWDKGLMFRLPAGVEVDDFFRSHHRHRYTDKDGYPNRKERKDNSSHISSPCLQVVLSDLAVAFLCAAHPLTKTDFPCSPPFASPKAILPNYHHRIRSVTCFR